MCFVAQMVNARALARARARHDFILKDVGSNLPFSLPFVLLSFCLKEKPISRFKPLSNASQICRLNAAFLYLTTCHGRIGFFLIDGNDSAKCCSGSGVIKLCLKRSLILRSFC